MTASRVQLAVNRWHFRHGPIDCTIEAEGDEAAVDAAFRAAWTRFQTVLGELVDELPMLKTAVGACCDVRGPIARRMWHACAAHRPRFVTPMAAVAGAVADALVVFFRVPGIRRAWVNNGGDIALHLAHGESARIGLVADIARFYRLGGRGDVGIDGRFAVQAASGVRGIATSGWRGRSLSLGVADSVTVLARTAADADAAATMIANAVDVDDPAIVRRPACDIADDSDLGDRLVTVDVPRFCLDTVQRALSAGMGCAEALRRAGVIRACALTLQGIGVVASEVRDPWSVRSSPLHAGASNPLQRATMGPATWHGTRLATMSAEVVA